MNKYKVFIRSENFLLDLDGNPRKVGFYATRFVEAQNKHEAEENAVSMVRTDITLLDAIRNEKSDAPILFVEEIAELDSVEDLTLPGIGSSFFAGDAAK